MDAFEQVKKTIDEHSLVNKGDALVLGLSGGPDSLCLLHILKRLEKTYSFSLYAFHLNHMIREDADDDESFVTDYCKEIGVPIRAVKADVVSEAKREGLSLEAAGRNIRHRLLKEYCEELQRTIPDGASARAVLAHNADDQAETVLLRILRGTGIHGLAAMDYMREDGLIRPLLDVQRQDIEKYCEEHHLAFRTDSTNSSEEYLRNKVRLSVIPMLEEINPSIKQGLRRLASSAASDDGYLSELSLNWYEGHVKGKEKEPILLVRDLRALEDALWPRVIMMAFEDAGLGADIEAVHIKALKRSVFANVGNKTVEFPQGYCAYINHGEVVFKKNAAARTEE